MAWYLITSPSDSSKSFPRREMPRDNGSAGLPGAVKDLLAGSSNRQRAVSLRTL